MKVSAPRRTCPIFQSLAGLVALLMCCAIVQICSLQNAACRRRGCIVQQEEILRQQLEGYAGTALQAYLEVENALDADKRLAEREAALRISLEEALKAEERLELRYTEGLTTILQLLDSQSRRLNAESQLISARKERLANRVRLHVALGGGDITQTAILPDAQIVQNQGGATPTL